MLKPMMFCWFWNYAKKKLPPPPQLMSRSGRFCSITSKKILFQASFQVSIYWEKRFLFFYCFRAGSMHRTEIPLFSPFPQCKSCTEKLLNLKRSPVSRSQVIRISTEPNRDSISFQKKHCPLISFLKWWTPSIASHLTRQTHGQCVGWTKNGV